jgi:pilus assembly protein Flp/PilA
MKKLISFLKDDSGATAIEYALLAAGMAVVLAAVVPIIQQRLTTLFTNSIPTGAAAGG